MSGKSKNFTFTLRGQRFEVAADDLYQFSADARYLYGQASDAAFRAIAGDVEVLKTNLPIVEQAEAARTALQSAVSKVGEAAAALSKVRVMRKAHKA